MLRHAIRCYFIDIFRCHAAAAARHHVMPPRYHHSFYAAAAYAFTLRCYVISFATLFAIHVAFAAATCLWRGAAILMPERAMMLSGALMSARGALRRCHYACRFSLLLFSGICLRRIATYSRYAATMPQDKR